VNALYLLRTMQALEARVAALEAEQARSRQATAMQSSAVLSERQREVRRAGGKARAREAWRAIDGTFI
jgi:hypothetical protein